MWIADGWKDYEVIDTSCGEKLERWGDYLLARSIFPKRINAARCFFKES